MRPWYSLGAPRAPGGAASQACTCAPAARSRCAQYPRPAPTSSSGERAASARSAALPQMHRSSAWVVSRQAQAPAPARTSGVRAHNAECLPGTRCLLSSEHAGNPVQVGRRSPVGRRVGVEVALSRRLPPRLQSWVRRPRLRLATPACATRPYLPGCAPPGSALTLY